MFPLKSNTNKQYEINSIKILQRNRDEMGDTFSETVFRGWSHGSIEVDCSKRHLTHIRDTAFPGRMVVWRKAGHYQSWPGSGAGDGLGTS
jgi:hypothetical protein